MSRRRQPVLDARRYENSIRFDGGERHSEIERVGNGLMRQLDDCSRPSEANSAQRKVVTAEVWLSRRPDVAVKDAHVFQVGRLIAGIGNVFMGGHGGGLAVKAL